MFKLVVVSLATASAQPPPAPTNPTAYYGVAGPLSQTAAETACVANGGNLASMHGDADHLLVKTACEAVSATGNCWIGLGDAAVEGTWVWTDGTTNDYTNWNTVNGEPNAWINGAPCPSPAIDERCASNLVASPFTRTASALATVCTLVPSADAGVTDGSCTELDAAVSTCSYAAAVPECTDPSTSPEDGASTLGSVSDTGDASDSSDDGKWNDADPAEPRAFVCSGTAPVVTTPAPTSDASAAARGAVGAAAVTVVAAVSYLL